MRATLAFVAAAMAVAFTPSARALDVGPDAALPQNIDIPGTSNGAATVYHFALSGFSTGKNGRLCAVGTLTGGDIGKVAPAGLPVRIPVQTSSQRGGGDDACNGDDGKNRGRGDDDVKGGFGVLQQQGPTRPAVYQLPWSARVQTAAFQGASASPMRQGLVIPAQFPPPPPRGGCNILNLRLGPINLNLLGLVVQTNTIVLNITGIPAQGLLGNLLCALLGP